MTAWLHWTDPDTGTRSLVRADCAEWLLPHRNRARHETEDASGYVWWHGSADAHEVTFAPDTARLGPRQAELLGYVAEHPGSTAADACGAVGNPYARRNTDRAWGLWQRGLLDIDTTQRNRYRLTITEAGTARLSTARRLDSAPRAVKG